MKESILLVAILTPFINTFQISSLNAESCEESIKNKVLIWSINKIKKSNLVQYEVSSCDVLKQMDKMSEEKILITTGRKRGKPLVCISDEKDNPCKFIIGNINPGIDSSEAIKQIYSFTPPQSSQINETVERLFLNPSSLIQ